MINFKQLSNCCVIERTIFAMFVCQKCNEYVIPLVKKLLRGAPDYYYLDMDIRMYVINRKDSKYVMPCMEHKYDYECSKEYDKLITKMSYKTNGAKFHQCVLNCKDASKKCMIFYRSEHHDVKNYMRKNNEIAYQILLNYYTQYVPDLLANLNAHVDENGHIYKGDKYNEEEDSVKIAYLS